MGGIEEVVRKILERRANIPDMRSLLVGVSGIDGCGKGYLATQLRAHLALRGVIPAILNVDGWLHDGALTREQKEYIFLVCSAANLSTYCVTAHCEIIRMLKIEGPEPEQIALDHMATDLPIVDKALLNFSLKLNNHPLKITQDDIDDLRTYGFDDQHIVETVTCVGLAKWANYIGFGLGTVPDYEVRLDLEKSKAVAV